MSTEVVIYEERECDICNMDKNCVSGTKAEYDAATVGGPWANMCHEHWSKHSYGRLGTGVGQKLIVQQLPENGPDADEGLTKCDICGEYDGEDDIVVVTDEEGWEDVTLCDGCAEDWD